MQSVNQQATLDMRYRTMVILWFALFLSIPMFFLLTVLIPRSEEVAGNKFLNFLLAGVATFAVVVSYFIKKRFLERSVTEQNIALVQTGMIIAASLTEVAAILGMLDYLLTGNRGYYLLMIIAVVGSLLNFPRRRHLLEASYKSSQPKDLWK